jgi:integrase/recombinase XerD
MFERLYKSEAARCRHRNGPFATERERYLKWCFESGSTPITLAVKGQSLLRFAFSMRASDRDGVDANRFNEIVSAVTSQSLTPGAIYSVEKYAKPWLRHLGWLNVPLVPTPFQEHLDNFEIWMRDERGLSVSTVNQWTIRCGSFLRWCGESGHDLCKLKPEDIDQYFVSADAKRWGRISSGYISTMLRVFLRHAESIGACPKRLADTIGKPRVYKLESLPCAMSWTDVQRVLASTESDNSKDIRDRAALMLMAVYGLRSGEVAGLRLDQIDWAGARINVGRLKNRKTQAYPLTTPMAEALARYIDTVRPQTTCPEVFVRLIAPHRPISTAGLSTTVHRRIKALNIVLARSGCHALRHSCAAKLLADGLTLKEIGDHLGHRSNSATMVYTKIDLAALHEVAEFDLGELA